MNLEDRAREYADGKSSASVFRDAHIRDFKAGYNQALKDTRFDEMLQELIKEVDILKSMCLGDTERCKRKEKLIKQATEL